MRERSPATHKADELAIIEGTGGAMTGHSELDQMTNGMCYCHLWIVATEIELRRVGHV